MLAASAIAIFLVPAIFYLVEKWSGAGKVKQAAAAINAPPAAGSAGTPTPAEGD
jgi:hypothetical protein